MRSVRSLAAAFWLVLALLAGQQAALLHDLGHATQAIQDGKGHPPGSDTCEKCSLYAPFSGVVTSYVAVLALEAAAIVSAFASFLPALSRTVVSSRSRAPPSSL